MKRPTPYSLTLTAKERSAIDWIGDRYDHGWNLYQLLNKQNQEREWGEEGSITFHFTESQAWEIHDLLGENPALECWSGRLRSKIYRFLDSIV